jgi:hypothetical protein
MSEHRYTPPDDPRLPKFKSYEEEAEFWDTHDAIDLTPLDPKELRELDKERTPMPPQPTLSRHLNIRVDESTYAAVEARARELGIGPSSLVRIWVRDRLRQERAAATAESPGEYRAGRS